MAPPDLPHPAASEEMLGLRGENLAARSFRNETIVLDMETSRYLTANPAASALWQELSRGCTRNRLVEVLLEHFEVTRERASRDVEAFLAELQSLGLLRVGERGG